MQHCTLTGLYTDFRCGSDKRVKPTGLHNGRRNDHLYDVTSVCAKTKHQDLQSLFTAVPLLRNSKHPDDADSGFFCSGQTESTCCSWPCWLNKVWSLVLVNMLHLNSFHTFNMVCYEFYTQIWVSASPLWLILESSIVRNCQDKNSITPSFTAALRHPWVIIKWLFKTVY